MSETIHEPETAGTTAGEAELHHLTCCDDDIAICGADVTGMAWDDSDPDPQCPLCFLAEADGLPCTVPGCVAGAS